MSRQELLTMKHMKRMKNVIEKLLPRSLHVLHVLHGEMLLAGAFDAAAKEPSTMKHMKRMKKT